MMLPTLRRKLDLLAERRKDFFCYVESGRTGRGNRASPAEGMMRVLLVSANREDGDMRVPALGLASVGALIEAGLNWQNVLAEIAVSTAVGAAAGVLTANLPARKRKAAKSE